MDVLTAPTTLFPETTYTTTTSTIDLNQRVDFIIPNSWNSHGSKSVLQINLKILKFLPF